MLATVVNDGPELLETTSLAFNYPSHWCCDKRHHKFLISTGIAWMAVINVNAVRLIRVGLEEIMMIPSQIEARASHALWVKLQFFFLPLKILVLQCQIMHCFACSYSYLHLQEALYSWFSGEKWLHHNKVLRVSFKTCTADMNIP